MEAIDMLVRHIRRGAEARCLEARGYKETAEGICCLGCGKNLEKPEPQEPEFVEIDVDQLSVEDVNYDATLIYGSFGAVHEDEGPLDVLDIMSQPTFYDSVNNY